MKKKMVVKVLIFFVLLTWLIVSFIRGNTYYTGRKYIAGGEYELLWGDPYSSTSTLGYSINAHGRIDSLKSVKWNNNLIIMEQNTDMDNRWNIIKSKFEGDTLQIMQDTLIRSLTKWQIDSVVKYYQYTDFHIEDLKKDIADRCYK